MVGVSLSPNSGSALSAIASANRTVNLLSAKGATTAAVGDILAAAGSVVKFIDTANLALSSLTTPINDPIGQSFSQGQPYGGTFITSPTNTQLSPANFNQSLKTSTQVLATLSAAQLAAIAGRVADVAISDAVAAVVPSSLVSSLLTDADLAAAMAVLFAQTMGNAKLAFSIDLANTTAIVPPVATSSIDTSTTAYVQPLAAQTNQTALTNFIAQSAASFPNISGIEGVAASVWVDGLGLTVTSDGTPIAGVPSNIDGAVYGDITTAATGLVPTIPTITVVDYSYQQNQFNLVIALAVDHGLTGTLTDLMAAALVTPATIQVLRNRLGSVALRGDASMLSTMFTLLGVDNIPDASAMLTDLLMNLRPSDGSSTLPAPVTMASGVELDTTTPDLTSAELLTHIQDMLTATGVTIQELCSQNTCDDVFCSQSLLNVKLIKSIDREIISSLLDPTTVGMAYML